MENWNISGEIKLISSIKQTSKWSILLANATVKCNGPFKAVVNEHGELE